MNDGIAGILAQWCLFWVIWMGGADRALSRLGITRRQLLTGLLISLTGSILGWQVVLGAAEIQMIPAILPILLAAWMWSHTPSHRRMYVGSAAFLAAALLFFCRKLIFWDPVLLVADEIVLLPLAAAAAVQLLSLEWPEQAVVLLTALPMADFLWQFSVYPLAGRMEMGGGAATDQLWVSVCLWAGTAAILLQVRKQGAAIGRQVTAARWGRWRTRATRPQNR